MTKAVKVNFNNEPSEYEKVKSKLKFILNSNCSDRKEMMADGILIAFKKFEEDKEYLEQRLQKLQKENGDLKMNNLILQRIRRCYNEDCEYHTFNWMDHCNKFGTNQGALNCGEFKNGE